MVSFNKVLTFSPGYKLSKTCVKGPLSKRPQIDFQDQLSLNAGQKVFIKLPFVIKIFVLPIFVWPFYTGFTVVA